MKFFIDTAKVEDIRKANDMGIICGVTTNPSLIAKEGRDFNEVIKEITSIVDGPISGEVKATTTDAEGMIKEGREIAAIHPNMVVKIPMTLLHELFQNQDHAVQQSFLLDMNAALRNKHFHKASCKYDHSIHHCAMQASGSYALP